MRIYKIYKYTAAYDAHTHDSIARCVCVYENLVICIRPHNNANSQNLVDGSIICTEPGQLFTVAAKL